LKTVCGCVATTARKRSFRDGTFEVRRS